jgi:hypothetical protein
LFPDGVVRKTGQTRRKRVMNAFDLINAFALNPPQEP